MQEFNLRVNPTDHQQLEKPEGGGTAQNKLSQFCGRAVAAAAIIGFMYLLAASSSSAQDSPFDERRNTTTCLDASQFTAKTGTPAPNMNDLYCTYADQNIPEQVAELVSSGIASLIEQAGTVIYHGAKHTFACINQGLTWRQYRDESACVGMDSGTCSSHGGYTSRGASICMPAVDLDIPVSLLCTKDSVDLCKWRH